MEIKNQPILSGLNKLYVENKNNEKTIPLAVLSRINKESLLARDASSFGLSLGSSYGNMYSRKLRSMKLAAPWLTFNTINPYCRRKICQASASQISRNSYQLLILELWCRSSKGQTMEICRHKPYKSTAWRSYL